MDWSFCNKVTFISFLVFSFCIFSHERKRFLKWLLLGGQSSRNRISLCFTTLFSLYIGTKSILKSSLISNPQQLILNFSLYPRLKVKIRKYLMKTKGFLSWNASSKWFWLACVLPTEAYAKEEMHITCIFAKKVSPEILLFLDHPVIQAQLETWKARN